MRRARVYYGVAIVSSLIAAYAATQATLLGRRLSSDEHATCIIQARGLPASHELAASMRDIHTLLTLRPQSRAQKLAAESTPSSVKVLLADLDLHLSRYQSAEAKQPATRTC